VVVGEGQKGVCGAPGTQKEELMRGEVDSKQEL
jgi:hypothetical protein